MSQPMSSGADSRHQRLMCVYCSSGRQARRMQMPPADLADDEHVRVVPMSRARRTALAGLLKPMSLMLPQVSVMSPVVRQELPPTSAPHFQTSAMPYWQRLKTMSRVLLSQKLPHDSYG